MDIADAKVRFEKGTTGTFDHLIWEQTGFTQVAPRIVLMRPTAQELGEYAGTYVNDELDLAIGVELQGAALIARLPEQAEARLAPDEKDRFASGARVLPLLIFRRDSQNRVTGFTIDADSLRDLVFTRK
jgi:hypothetical protein